MPSGCLRVLIAEDEELIRQGLKREIPWASLGMEVLGLAANGQEALQLCRELRPDILLTDIRMPLLDGLELIRRVRELPGEVVFVIISGYDDFQYAQRAISLGVSDYFLKPLELEPMEARLAEIGGQILARRRESETQATMGQFVDKVLPFVRRQYFLELIYGPYDNREVARRLAGFGALHEGSSCAAVLVEASLAPGRQSNRSVERHLGRLLGNPHYGGEDIYLLRRTERQALAVVVFVGDHPEELAAGIEAYLREVRLLEAVSAAAGGAVHQGVASLHRSFVEARKELLLWTVLRRSGLSLPPQAPEASGGFEVREIGEALKAGNAARLAELLDRLEASTLASAGSEGDRTAVLVEVIRLLSSLAEEGGLNLESAFRKMPQGAAYDRGDAGLGHLFSMLRSLALELVARRSTRREKPARHLIDKALRFIDERYAAWDLSLEEVADHVELNPSYFSAVFKSVTGVNYIDYLTALRLEKARQLLEQDRLKIGAVARLVGFQTPGYFGYLFKKHFDLTPSQYKARGGR